MKKMLYLRNSIIIVLSITTLFLGIGFIVLSVKLNNLSKQEHIFNPVFTKIEKISSIKASEIEPISKAKISDNGRIVNIDYTLNAVHDEIIYDATIKNKGTLPCEIIDIFESPDYNNYKLSDIISPVTIKTSDIKGKIIPPNEEIQIKITAYYNPTNKEVVKKNFNYNLGFFAKSR